MGNQFTLPPDTRAVGTGNPPQDMNGVVDALQAQGVLTNVLNSAYAGGADPTGVADSTAAFQVAASALPASGGVVRIPPGTYRINGPAITTTGPNVLYHADGGGTTQINYYGSGDCFRMYSTASSPPRYGGVVGAVIDGTHATGSAAGIHAGDLFQTTWDVVVQNFSGTGMKGAWFDNNYTWTEMIQGKINAINCYQGVVFDHNDVSGISTGSFDRMMLTVELGTQGAGDGVTFQNGAQCFDGILGIYGNDVYGVSKKNYVLVLTGSDSSGYSRYQKGILNIGVELRNPGSGTQNGTINFGAAFFNVITGCQGIIDFGANAAYAGATNSVNSFQFTGPIFGDSTLFQTKGGDPQFNAGTALANGGSFHAVSDVISVQPTSNLTGMSIQNWVINGQSQNVRLTIINRSTTFSVTFAASGSNVAGGSNVSIPPDTQVTFWWDPNFALWIPNPAAVTPALLTVTGLTGATAASRYVGGTASGPPASGTFAAGDFVIDETAAIWVCTAAGSPGTWNAAVGNDYYAQQQIASGETSIPRTFVQNGAALATQTVHLTYFTALKTETINNIVGQTANVAAGATPTYCAMGLYSVAANGNLTLVGQCANDTTLFAATFTTYTRAVTASFTKQAGQRYAFAYLVVSAAAMPAMFGYNGTTALTTTAPRITGVVTGQATLPGSVTAGSVSSNSSMNLGAVTP